MADVMEVSGKERRAMRKIVEEFCAARDERERMLRAINDLYCLHAMEREHYDHN